jgi:uncharacterized membrane protein
MLCLNLFENLEKVNILSQRSFNIFNVIFVILAACIATLGFLYNSTDAIVGSMLVSAITNPLLTFIILFLLNQYTTSLIKMFHFFSLVVVAIIISVWAGYMNQKYKVFMTPTYEMKARIKISHVVVDVLLALLSGFGIGIAILNKDVVSRVGFAIILSITPPIINFGLFFGQALYKYINDEKTVKNREEINSLFSDANRSLILSALNILAMFLTLFLTLTILCKTGVSV